MDVGWVMATDAVRFLAAETRWRVAAGQTEVEARAGAEGVSLVFLRDGASGREWRFVDVHPSAVFSLAGERLGTRSWRLRGWEADEHEQHVVLRVELAEATGDRLGLTETIWVAKDVPVIRRWVVVKNAGKEAVTIERYHLLNVMLDHDLGNKPVELCSVDAFAGHRLDRWEPGDANFAMRVRDLKAGDAVRYPVGAYQQGCSWLTLKGDGVGLAVGLEYDGAAEIRVFDAARTAGAATWATVNAGNSGRGVRLTAAPSGDINLRLEPGETWTSPAAFLALCGPEWDAAAQVTHALVERHLAPPADEDFPYVIFNSWGYGWDLDPERLLRCLDLAAEVGVEVFVADYGWARDVGDWEAVGERMPLLPDLRKLVVERGMKFGAWMGFGNAGPSSPVLRAHPDWKAYPDDWGSFRSRALCLAEPAVREWVTGEVLRVVREYGLDYLVHDFEVISPCTHPGHQHPLDPAGYHSAMGYNEVLRKVREAHPGLVIENCTGGGRLMTYAMVQLHDTSITSDGAVLADALARRQALYGASYPFPLRYCDNYMEERPTDVACHSSMIGGPWILMDKLSDWTEQDFETARRNVALYKKIRPRFHDAQVFHLRWPDGVGWDALQVQQRERGLGVLYLFQPEKNGPVAVQLRGLDSRREYRLVSGTSGEEWRASGEVLSEIGLEREMAAGSSDVVLIDPV